MSDAAAKIVVRPLLPDDRAAWEPLWQGYLAFYKASVPAETTNLTWARLHDPAEPMHVFGAEVDGRLLGIVHYIFHRSTWTPGPYCYLQDLYVDEAARGHGLGRRLIEAVYAEAAAQGASRVYWLTHEGNATARMLYDRIADQPGFMQYRKLL